MRLEAIQAWPIFPSSNRFPLHHLLFLLPRGKKPALSRSILRSTFQAWIIKTRRRWRRWMNYNREPGREKSKTCTSGDFACTIPRPQIDLSSPPISITGIHDNCARALPWQFRCSNSVRGEGWKIVTDKPSCSRYMYRSPVFKPI